MTKYDVILMDADETLFDFKKAEREAFRRTYTAYGFTYDDAVYERYHDINESLWRLLEQGLISQDELRRTRFLQLFGELGVTADSAAFNRDYSAALGPGAFLMDGALELCQTLSERFPLYIVTNGSLCTQVSRLANSDLYPYITRMFVSEKIGFQKPHREYFEHVLNALGKPDKKRTILLGNSLASDMTGGRSAGIDTCWFAPPDTPDTVGCTYRISRLLDFIPIAMGHQQQSG